MNITVHSMVIYDFLVHEGRGVYSQAMAARSGVWLRPSAAEKCTTCRQAGMYVQLAGTFEQKSKKGTSTDRRYADDRMAESVCRL